MKMISQRIFYFLVLPIFFVVVACSVISKDMPQTIVTSNQADELAHKMLAALNSSAYTNTQFLEWSFRGKHHYKWNKLNGVVWVSWKQNQVELHTDHIEKSKVHSKNSNKTNQEIIEKALAYFNNDSFWLVAPYKVFDEGVKRSVVSDKGGTGLKVTYTSGGTTPGDTYIWYLDDHYFPKYYRMWVKIIPIGGLKATWDSWEKTNQGVLLPTKHKILGLTIDMGEVKAY